MTEAGGDAGNPAQNGVIGLLILAKTTVRKNAD